MTVNIVWVEVYFSGVLLKNPVSVISESVNSDMEKSKGINEISSFGVTFKKMHEFLEVDTNYTTGFKRMCEYGFTENIDYALCFPNLESEMRGSQNKQDHQLTIEMAKEICMLQRNEKG